MPIPTQDYSDLLIQVKKFLTWFLPSTLGVATKLAFDSRLKKLSLSHIFTSVIMSCFVGYVCDVGCTHYGIIDFRGVLVAIGALVAESLIGFFFRNDRKIINNFILRVFNINITPEKNDTSSTKNTD